MGHDMGVLVFRRQDAQKVLVHELLHLFEIDALLRGLPRELEERVVRNRRGLWSWRLPAEGSALALNEAYTDALACFIFCDGDLARARAHAVSKAARVLAHFRWGALPFQETTHAFAYYVVKAAMLVSLDARALMRLMTGGASPEIVVSQMEKSLRSPKFRASLMSVPSGDAVDRGIHMSDGRPMVF